MKKPGPDQDYYKILGINRDATILDIEAAWQKKQREYDPGKLHGLGDKLRECAEAEMERIHAAYETLKHPEKRKEYNRMLADGAGKLTEPTQVTQREKTMSRKAATANDRAIEHWQQSRFEEAIAQWEEAVQHNPNIAEIHHNLGNAYAHQGNIESAVESLKRAISIDPSLLEAYNKLGCIYYRQGNLDLAYASWNLALKVDPNFKEALHNIKLIQNVTQFDVDSEIPTYQHITKEGAEQSGSAGDDDKPTWKDRIRQGLAKFRIK
ncbi:MAG: tetratricopeptide repeat protein [Candidatus Poribacteria bacterium]|nr:tetratricopeptide repeat protein [Candidatus Poribacteria bacterium]